MRVAILGGGPAGLLAAWAVVDAGHHPIIHERRPHKPDGTTAGVFYLHADCHLPLRKQNVHVVVSGGGTDSVERQLAYEEKVYGTRNSTHVSLPTIDLVESAYDGMQALGLCWDITHQFIAEHELLGWQHVLAMAERYELVINTIPLNLLLPEKEWKSQEATIYRSDAPLDESYMLYNVNPAVPWYRASAVFGVFTLEYSLAISRTDMREPQRKEGRYVKVRKVIDSPDAMPDLPPNVLLTGRYGAWSKSKLSHHAYYDTMRRLVE